MGLKCNWIYLAERWVSTLCLFCQSARTIKSSDMIEAGLCSSTYEAIPVSGSKSRSHRQLQCWLCEGVCVSPSVSEVWLFSHWAVWASGWTAGPFSLPCCSCWASSSTVLSVRRLTTLQQNHLHLHRRARPLKARRQRTRTMSGGWTRSEEASRPSAATLTLCWSSWADVMECANTAVDMVRLLNR